MRTLFGSMIAALALVAAGAAQADVKVGVTAAVNPQAIGQPPSEPERMLLVGSDNFANEKITTGPEGQVQLLFIDGSSLSVGPDANLTIDQYVYDTNAKVGKFAITAAQGVFRLVGGAISKTGEILITTPTATAGIRGGIANIDARPNQPMHAQFLFGTSLRVTAQGVTQEATRPGFQITVLPGQPPLPPVKLTTAEVRGTLGSFQGRARASGAQTGQGGQPAGQSGGQEAPQDQALTTSGLSSVSGSDQAPQTLSTIGSLGTESNNLFNPNTLSILNNIVTQAAATNLVDQNLATTLYGHFYCCNPFLSGTFNVQSLMDTPDPSNNFTFTARITASNLTFTLPVQGTQTQTFNFSYNAGQSTPFSNLALINGNLISGNVMVSQDRQFFDIFGNVTVGPGNNCGGGGGDCKFGLFAGVPTTALPTRHIDTYAVNPIFDTIPFVHNNAGGGNGNGLGLPGAGSAGVASSPMFVAWSPVTNPSLASSSDQRATWLQSTLVISGSGAQQQSGLFGATGSFFQESGSTVAFGGGLVGMARTSATGDTTRVASGISSAPISTPSGSGNAIYGPNAEFIVAVPDILSPSPGQADVRQPAAQEQIPFSTLTNGQNSNDNLFVNVLTQNSAGSAPTQTANATSRTNQTLNGYTGGILDTRSAGGSVTNGAAMFGGTVPDGLVANSVTIQTSADNNRMAAQFSFTDNNSNSYNLNFGSTSGYGAGRSAFINDQIFAARETLDTNNNPTSQFNGTTVPFTKLFMVSAATVPIDFQTFAGAGVTACTCSFMQWGWWIGEVQNPNGARERFNLATWVAGVLPNIGDLPTTGSATYVGHAIGNVSTGGANYIAAGTFTQNWSFASKSGTAIITSFDRSAFGPSGATISGPVSAGNGRDFTGSLNGPSAISGSIAGSIYRSPSDAAAGVGGSFAVSNGSYKAAGTFAAQR